MRNIWMIEFKKLHSRSMYMFLGFFVIFTVLDNFLYLRLIMDKPDLLVGNFGLSLFLTHLYFIYLASVSITADFQLGTSRVLYTGVYSRVQIILMKAKFLLCICVGLALLNVLIGASIELAVTGRLYVSEALIDFIQLLMVYGLYIGSIYSFSVLLSALCLNRLYVLICNYVAFIFVGELAAQAVQRGSAKLAQLMETLPFYVVTNGFSQLEYTFSSAILLVIFGAVTSSLGIVVFRKRDFI